MTLALNPNSSTNSFLKPPSVVLGDDMALNIRLNLLHLVIPFLISRNRCSVSQHHTKNVPPHVRAARMLDRFDGRIVNYVITTAGLEPVQKRSDAAYDYDHYSER
jgi:hypothetical protein